MVEDAKKTKKLKPQKTRGYIYSHNPPPPIHPGTGEFVASFHHHCRPYIVGKSSCEGTKGGWKVKGDLF